MTTKVLSCKILQNELEILSVELELELHYVDAGLHVNPDNLAKTINYNLNLLEEQSMGLIFGNLCFTDLESTTRTFNTIMPDVKNCIEMVADPKLIAALSDEAKTFFITPGWLENWEAIFKEGLKWDGIDARQNFGPYERIVLFDTGVCSINDLKILEFYDYTQTPVEIVFVGLERLRNLLINIK